MQLRNLKGNKRTAGYHKGLYLLIYPAASEPLTALRKFSVQVQLEGRFFPPHKDLC